MPHSQTDTDTESCHVALFQEYRVAWSLDRVASPCCDGGNRDIEGPDTFVASEIFTRAPFGIRCDYEHNHCKNKPRVASQLIVVAEVNFEDV